MRLLQPSQRLLSLLCILGIASCEQAPPHEPAIKPDPVAVQLSDEPVANTAAEAEQLGTFSGQVLFEGEIPKLEPVVVASSDRHTKDLKACGVKEVPDERWVIHPESKGLANVFVYLVKKPAGMPQRFHKSTKSEVTYRTFGCRYVPHASFARTDQVLVAVSDDPVGHHAHDHSVRNSYGKGLGPDGKEPSRRFKVAERIPFRVTCDIHPWMEAWWLVLDHPYAAITDKDGKFQINDLPIGDHEFVVWHEEKGYIERQVLVRIESAKATELKFAVNAEKTAPAKP